MIDRYGLFRDPSRGCIAGVAAGLAERFGLTVGVVRLGFVLLGLCLHVLALVLYVALAVLLPARPLMIDSASYRRRWRRDY